MFSLDDEEDVDVVDVIDDSFCLRVSDPPATTALCEWVALLLDVVAVADDVAAAVSVLVRIFKLFAFNLECSDESELLWLRCVVVCWFVIGSFMCLLVALLVFLFTIEFELAVIWFEELIFEIFGFVELIVEL